MKVHFTKVSENKYYVYPCNPELLKDDYSKIHKLIGVLKKYKNTGFKYVGNNLNYPLSIENLKLITNKLIELNNY